MFVDEFFRGGLIPTVPIKVKTPFSSLFVEIFPFSSRISAPATPFPELSTIAPLIFIAIVSELQNDAAMAMDRNIFIKFTGTPFKDVMVYPIYG